MTLDSELPFVGALPRGSAANQALGSLWQAIERKLARSPKAG